MSAHPARPATEPSPSQAQRLERRRLRWLWTILADDQRRHRLLFFGGLATLTLIATMGYLTHRTQALPGDLDVTLSLQGLRPPLLRDFMYLVSLPGYLPWAPALVLAASLVVARRLGWQEGAYLLGITAGQGLVNHAIKSAIARPRPTAALVEVFLTNHGNSFPSGHVMLYTVFFGFLFFLAWSRLPRSPLRTLALVLTSSLVLLIGPSRIFLGAHWLSDVVAAHLLGLLILLFAIEFHVKHIAPPKREVAEVAAGRAHI